MKNYIGFVNDHSGSMAGEKAKAALKDYNTTITAVKDSASREMLDSVVSVIGIGVGRNGVERQVTVSNPHVLRPKESWPTPGGTPLWDGVYDMILLHESLPDADKEDVSFLIITTTDGQDEYSSKYSKQDLANKIAEKQRTGRWTFVFRIPTGYRRTLEGLNVPQDNIQEWENSAAGMEASTQAQTAAVSSYFTMRSAGVSKSSTTFYATAKAVDTKALTDITKDVSLYVVPQHEMGIEIRDFILKHRMQYLKGSAFYQLTKTEPRVQHTKMIAIRDRSTGKIYAGKEARQMIGLPVDSNARLHPGDHGNYDIFIQSESVNRKLVAGTGVLYWEAIGKPFTAADLEYLKPKAPAVVQLPAVAPTNKPTHSPIPVAKKTPVIPSDTIMGASVKWFITRDEGREYVRKHGGSLKDATNFNFVAVPGKRWFVFV